MMAELAEVARGGMTGRQGAGDAHHVARAGRAEVVGMGIVTEGLEGHGVVELERIDRHASAGVHQGSAETTRAHGVHGHADGTGTGGKGGGGSGTSGAVPCRGEDASSGLLFCGGEDGGIERRMGRLTLIIQLLTWLIERPVAWQSCFFSSSEG